MTKRLGQRLLEFVPGCLLLGWGIFVYWLHRDELLTLYISRRVEWMVRLAAAGCYVLGGLLIIQALFKKKSQTHAHDNCGCSCSHEDPSDEPPSLWQASQTISLGLLLLPFILSWLWPPAALGSQAAALKGVDLAPSSIFTERYADNRLPAIDERSSIESEEIEDPLEDEMEFVQVEVPEQDGLQAANPSMESSNVMFPSDAFTKPYAVYAEKLIQEEEIVISEKHFIETIMTLDLYRDKFYGKRVRLEGFVHHMTGMKDEQLAVTRFAMQCCAADSTPYGLLAVNETDHVLQRDEWIEASGILREGSFQDHDVMVLHVDQLRKIEPKSDPYVYQDLEFGL